MAISLQSLHLGSVVGVAHGFREIGHGYTKRFCTLFDRELKLHFPWRRVVANIVNSSIGTQCFFRGFNSRLQRGNITARS